VVEMAHAGGVSVGINLNPNNACNWRCAYCQVEGLILGSGPALDLDLNRLAFAVLSIDLREHMGCVNSVPSFNAEDAVPGAKPGLDAGQQLLGQQPVAGVILRVSITQGGGMCKQVISPGHNAKLWVGFIALQASHPDAPACQRFPQQTGRFLSKR